MGFFFGKWIGTEKPRRTQADPQERLSIAFKIID
jgi:hypothetical protein